jgi:NAD-dependent deacetylase
VAGALGEARNIVLGAGSVVVLTGAGISTEAGIPDFRGPDGVWTRNPAAQRLSTLSHYLEDAEVRKTAWRNRLDAPIWSARPTAGHRALVELERRGTLEMIVTQNTDGLHQAAGSSPDVVVEIHGSAHFTECWSCKELRPTLEVLERVRAGDVDPRCDVVLGGRACGGILKTATVSFGQSLDPDRLERAQQAAAGSDVLVAVGSTLEVHPVAGIVPIARRNGASVVIVNGGPTAYDHLADVVVNGRIGEVLPEIVAGPRPA